MRTIPFAAAVAIGLGATPAAADPLFDTIADAEHFLRVHTSIMFTAEHCGYEVQQSQRTSLGLAAVSAMAMYPGDAAYQPIIDQRRILTGYVEQHRDFCRRYSAHLEQAMGDDLFLNN